ncbi:MAG: FAD-dependent oxidoreductase [Deltaproteobacteria bacterium]|nr:FAD-dependent oxidoreductase [Deltaproteobacteria bacterium]
MADSELNGELGKTKGTRIVVIGASAAGMRAACRARRLMPDARILVIDSTAEISVGACGLPYVLAGDIDSGEDLRKTSYDVLRDQAFFENFKGVEVRCGLCADRLDLDEKLVEVIDIASGERMRIDFDKLVLTTGAKAMDPFNIPVDSKRIRAMKTPRDVRTLKHGLETGQIESVVVIGGGFIGCETAEAFSAMWGARVTLIEAMPQVLPGVLDEEMAALVHSQLKEQEVELVLGKKVMSIEEMDRGVEVMLESGRKVKADAAVCALGVVPCTEFGVEAGLNALPNGALIVDEYMQTSHPDVYAAGDCISVVHCLTGERVYLPLGSLANRHGRLIGDNLAGRRRKAGPITGSSAVKVFDLNVGRTGLTKAQAEMLGIECNSVWGTFNDKAHYYPETREIHFKLVYRTSDMSLLGLQAIGQGEVVREVDVMSSLLQRAANAADLLDLDTAYAPPYSGAVSALHFLGAAVLNAEQDGLRPIPPVSPLNAEKIIDVREPSEAGSHPVESSTAPILSIPLGKLRSKISDLNKEENILFVCARGTRSYEAARMFKNYGFEHVVYLGGGLSFRRDASFASL